MSDWSEMQIKFRLIAARAELMSRSNIRPWASDIQHAAREIGRLSNEIEQDSRQFEAADR